MKTKAAASPLPRLSVPVAEAMANSGNLASLLDRVQASTRRLVAAHAALPAGLAAHLSAGPLDEAGWTILAHSGAAAAKLRQCIPAIQQRLCLQGWPEVPIRVKVHVSRRG